MRRLLLVVSILAALWGTNLQANATDDLPTISQPGAFQTNERQADTDDNSKQVIRASQHRLSLPAKTPTPTDGYRWPTRKIKIYMATQDKPLQAAFKGAVKAWNETGAVHISWCHSEGRADIIAQDGDLSSGAVSPSVGYVSSQLGVTSTSYNPDTHALIQARSTLDASHLDYMSPTFRREVAEHELGHALGLAHAPEYTHSVMIPRNIRTGITRADRVTIRALYLAH